MSSVTGASEWTKIEDTGRHRISEITWKEEGEERKGASPREEQTVTGYSYTY